MVDSKTVPLSKSLPLTDAKGWSIRELKLPRDEMIETIAGLNSVPAEFKGAYIAAVRLVPDNFKFIRFDAHAQIVKGKVIEHCDASGF